jgi:hypothetical protein
MPVICILTEDQYVPSGVTMKFPELFQSINASYVEVVPLILRVCFYVSSQEMSDRIL